MTKNCKNHLLFHVEHWKNRYHIYKRRQTDTKSSTYQDTYFEVKSGYKKILTIDTTMGWQYEK